MHDILEHDSTPQHGTTPLSSEAATEQATRKQYCRPALEVYDSVAALTGDFEFDFGTS